MSQNSKSGAAFAPNHRTASANPLLQGQGLGNAFLSHINAVDGIFHVCRAFDDADVVHVEDRVDPVEGGWG